jgi:two-component system chemotaxis response regulator CheB
MGEILDRAGLLPAKLAEDKEKFQPGHIYVAPPNYHLLVKEDHLRVTLGPRENRVRPAIDPLFRSAAAAHGPKVVGVVLTGYLDDGTAGLLAIKRCNGLAVVQDLYDAAYPDMPRNAMEKVAVDYTVPLAEMGLLLSRLVREPVRAEHTVPEDILFETRIAENMMETVSIEENLGKLVPFSCPECQGPLWEVEEDKLRRYRCHVGHAFTAQTLLAEQGQFIEQTLWIALRSVEEHLEVLSRLIQDEQADGLSEKGEQYQEQMAMVKQQAENLRTLLNNNDRLPPDNLPAVP